MMTVSEESDDSGTCRHVSRARIRIKPEPGDDSMSFCNRGIMLNVSTSREHFISQESLQYFLYGKRTPRLDSGHITAPQINCPPQVRLSQSCQPGQSWGIFSTVWMKEGTEMGPFMGTATRVSDLSSQTLHSDSIWEIVNEQGEMTSLVVGSATCWLSYVNCARNDGEQNLEVLQVSASPLSEEIYYRVTKTISPGQELLVWYGKQYNLFFGIPFPTISIQQQQDHVDGKLLSTASTLDLKSSNSSYKLRCVICQRGFNSKSNLRSHMRVHTQEKPFICCYCKRSFSQSSTLRNHVRLHTGERPYRCTYCQCAYSQLAGLRAHQKSARHKPYITALHRHQQQQSSATSDNQHRSHQQPVTASSSYSNQLQI